MKTKKILLLAIAVLLLSLLIYLFVFHQGLSNNHEEWGSFGSYIGGIGGIVLSCSLFYYTYTIDKDNKRTKNNTQVLKLLDVVGESLVLYKSWEALNVKLSDPSTFKGTHEQYMKEKEEREKLEIQLWINYKTTQVLAHHIYGINVEDVDKMYLTEGQFKYVFYFIKNHKVGNS